MTKNRVGKTWLSIGLFTLLSTAVVAGCSSKATKADDSMGISGSSASSSSSPSSTTVAANSGSSANLGAASSGNSR